MRTEAASGRPLCLSATINTQTCNHQKRQVSYSKQSENGFQHDESISAQCRIIHIGGILSLISFYIQGAFGGVGTAKWFNRRRPTGSYN